MKRRLALPILLLALVTALAALCGLRWFGPREPRYRGQTLSAWLDQLKLNPKPQDGPEETAIRNIGTNAIPILLHWVASHDSALKTWWVGLVSRQDWLPFQPHFDPALNQYASSAFEVLGSEGEAAVPGLTQLLHHHDSQVRADAAQCLGEIEAGAKSAVGELSRALADKNDEVRSEAACALGRIHENGAQVVPLLIQDLTNNAPEVQAEIARALGPFGPEARDAVPLLLELLEGSSAGEPADDRVRAAAASALGEIGENPATVVPALIATLRDQDVSVRREAVRSLGLLGDDAREAVPLLVRFLPEAAGDSGEPDADELALLRGCAAESLGDIQCEAALIVPALIASLSDSDATARRLKAESLGRFGEQARSAVPPLTTLLGDEDADVRASATNAVAAITSGPAPSASVR
jgi:HEAT repeat protein